MILPHIVLVGVSGDGEVTNYLPPFIVSQRL